MDNTEYQAEYDKASAELEAAAQATTARGEDGRFVKAEEPATEAQKAPTEAPAEQAAKVEPAQEETDPVAELKARLEKAEKIAKDNQAWATKLAQEAAALRREKEAQRREASKPAILDANPELAEAIRYVANDPAPREQEEQSRQAFAVAIEKAHPGIFDNSLEKELQDAIAERWQALGPAGHDPLEVIRVITEEKLAHAERQVGKRFAAEAAKQAQKSAMSVPGAGAGSSVSPTIDAQLQEVQRIQKMSDADFAKEVRRVKGY